MKTLQAIHANIEAGNAGSVEVVYIISAVILIAVICYFLPDTSKKVQTSRKY